jgi:hypothetical protein
VSGRAQCGGESANQEQRAFAKFLMKRVAESKVGLHRDCQIAMPSAFSRGPPYQAGRGGAVGSFGDYPSWSAVPPVIEQLAELWQWKLIRVFAGGKTLDQEVLPCHEIACAPAVVRQVTIVEQPRHDSDTCNSDDGLKLSTRRGMSRWSAQFLV